MSKFKILFLIFIFNISTFTLCVVLNWGKLQEVWFSLALLLIGGYSLVYSYLYKLDSSLFYGTLLVLIGLSSAYKHFNEISFGYFYPIYIGCFALASFTVFVFFRQNIHFKQFAILAIEAILLISYKLKFINIFFLVGINAMYLALILANVLLRVRKNLRRVK